MSADAKFLTEFNLTEYRDKTFQHGRLALAQDETVRRGILERASAAQHLRMSDWRGIHGRDARFAHQVGATFLDSQAYIFTHDQARYEPYASISLLRELLGVEQRQPLPVIEKRIWGIFMQILHDQIQHEMSALCNFSAPAAQFDPKVAQARVAKLRDVIAKVPASFRIIAYRPSMLAASLAEVVATHDPLAMAADLLVFPQTNCHDEVAFIRSIHLTECLFWGASLFVQRALTAYHLGNLGEATTLVACAADFARPLPCLAQMVALMPKGHFAGFREATGEASAVQSSSWQHLDAYMHGVLPEKVAVLRATPEVSAVLRLRNPHFVSLIEVGNSMRSAAPEELELRHTIENLDHGLRGWRQFHTNKLAGAKNPGYLPPQAFGTGGTSGYQYLADQKPPRLNRASSNVPTEGLVQREAL